MKIAYLMLVHQNPRLLKRAIKALSSKNSVFFVHVDRKVALDSFAGLASDNVFFCEQRVPVYWGEFSQVDATMVLVRRALASSQKCDYLVFMQGSDYPLRSSEYIETFLNANRGTQFMSLVKMPAPGYPISKISKLRYPSDQPLRRFASRVLGRVGLAHRSYKKHLPGLDAYAGDACWALSGDACRYIADFTDGNPQVEHYFRHTFTADEMFFQTIIANSPFRTQVKRSLVYRDWPAGGNHPVTLDEAHVKYFEERDAVWIEDQFGSGEALFARKFSDARLELLERIDAMIRRKEQTRLQRSTPSGRN